MEPVPTIVCSSDSTITYYLIDLNYCYSFYLLYSYPHPFDCYIGYCFHRYYDKTNGHCGIHYYPSSYWCYFIALFLWVLRDTLFAWYCGQLKEENSLLPIIQLIITLLWGYSQCQICLYLYTPAWKNLAFTN